jgi:hypothetical protein
MLVERMRGIGLEAHALDDHFAQSALDIEWLPQVALEGWIVITKDHSIQHNPAEIDAIMTHRIGVFLLPKTLRGEEQAALVERVHKRMVGIATGRSRPFIYGIHRDGRIERRDTSEWLEPWRKARVARGLPPSIL